MTPRQSEAIAAIRRLTVDGVPPTWEALRVELGLRHKSGVHRLLTELRRDGLVWWTWERGGSLVILADQVSDTVLAKLSVEALKDLGARVYLALADRELAG